MTFQTFRTLIAAAVVTLSLSAPAMADVVIQWASSNNNVTLQSGGILAAVGNTRNAARFEIVRLEGRRIALRASDGSYVRAGAGQQTLLASGSPHIRGWETFVLDSAGGDTFSLRSLQNGKFVELDASGRLAATADIRNFQTQLRLITVGERPQAQRPDRPQVEWAGTWRQVWVTAPDGRRRSAPRGTDVRFTIARDMTVSITAGCNTIGSRLTLRGQRATFAPAMMTRMRCDNVLQRFEQRLAGAMDAVQSYEYREGQIAFLNARGHTILQIAR